MIERKTILIAEANPELRELFHKKFETNEGYNILLAKDGLEALGKIRRQKFDLIIVQGDIPKKNALDVVGETRESDNNLLTPIIVCTDDIEKHKLYTRAVKNIEFLQSPASPEDLYDKASSWLSAKVTKKKFRIDVDFINPFIDSAISTLETMCKAQGLEHEQTYLQGKDEKLDVDISGTLKISSPYFKGIIAISYPDEVYQKLVLGILENKDKDIDLNNQDAAAEMINIVFGKTKAELNGKGYKLERAVPNVLRGNGHKIQSSNAPVLLLPFNSNAGKFFIQISVQAS
jgi:CheY-specific phosphatase CheX